MTYKEHKPAVYLVGWRENRVIKAGFTCNQRYRKFVIRGAELLALSYFKVSTDAFAHERHLEDELRLLGPSAFDTKTDEARDLLGSGCGGYMECHRVDPEHWAKFVSEQCSVAMLTSNASEQWHGRTDVTDALRTSSPTSETSSSVTRGRTYGICR